VFLYFAAGSVAIVWGVFQSPAIDYRMVMAGSLLATVEIPFGVGPLQSLLAPVVALGLVMAATVGRRLVRRQWLGVPIGMFLRLVLDGSWSNASTFWWPITSVDRLGRSAPVLDRGWWSALLELVGLALALGLWTAFGLDDLGRRSKFVRTGQLDRSFVKDQAARS